MSIKSGFIYKTEDGEFLLRILNRGYFDAVHYVFKGVNEFSWACLLDGEIVIDKDNRDSVTGIKYRTMFSKEVVAGCTCENVTVSGDAWHGFEITTLAELKGM